MAPNHHPGAILLAALLLVSLPAVAGAPDGARSLPSGDGSVVAAVAAADYDLAMESGETHWAGQRLYFNGSAVVDDLENASTSERTFQLRGVTDGGDLGPLVREFVVDADGEAVVRTGSLEGTFVVRYDGEPVYVQDGTGYTATRPDGMAVTAENSAWEVAAQTLSASWSDERVTRNEIVDLRLESNRARYLVEVSAEGLTFEDLESIFNPHYYANDHDVRADDDVIVLRGGRNVDVGAYFAGIDEGTYVLAIEVVDADARTTAEVRVGRARTTTAAPSATTAAPGTTPATTVPPETTTAVATTNTPGPTGTATTAAPVTTTPGQPGFGPLGGALAVGAAGWLAARRRE